MYMQSFYIYKSENDFLSTLCIKKDDIFETLCDYDFLGVDTEEIVCPEVSELEERDIAEDTFLNKKVFLYKIDEKQSFVCKKIKKIEEEVYIFQKNNEYVKYYPFSGKMIIMNP